MSETVHQIEVVTPGIHCDICGAAFEPGALPLLMMLEQTEDSTPGRQRYNIVGDRTPNLYALAHSQGWSITHFYTKRFWACPTCRRKHREQKARQRAASRL